MTKRTRHVSAVHLMMLWTAAALWQSQQLTLDNSWWHHWELLGFTAALRQLQSRSRKQMFVKKKKKKQRNKKIWIQRQHKQWKSRLKLIPWLAQTHVALTIEVPAAAMRPPSSVTHPVQTSRQFHDAKLVPVCNSHSSIKQQHPGSSAHSQVRCSLQTIRCWEYYLSSLELLIPRIHFSFCLISTQREREQFL